MADAEPTIPHPRETYALVGHETAEAELAGGVAGGRLHHAWMFSGPEGIGKATLAYRFARRLLGAKPDPGRGTLGSSPDDPVCRRVQSGGHGGLFVLERPTDAKTGRVKGVIPVDEARRMKEFFQSTAAEGGRRVAIVDAADDLNVNAANAILKVLEEPPAGGVIILVAHSPGRMLATIRSRCRKLVLEAPGVEATAKLVREMTGAKPAEATAAAEFSEGRPGIALALLESGGASLQADLVKLTGALATLDAGEAGRIATELSARDAEGRRAQFFAYLARFARDKARDAARDGGAVEAWGALWDKLARLEAEEAGLHLDPKLVVLEALGAARDAAQGRTPS